MSVLVKRMKMPNACTECPLNHDKMLCSVTGTQWWSDRFVLLDFDEYNERLPDCPLVELPKKHGRLIDAFKLLRALIRKEPFNDCARVVIAECMEEIRQAPTVIEAEDE